MAAKESDSIQIEVVETVLAILEVRGASSMVNAIVWSRSRCGTAHEPRRLLRCLLLEYCTTKLQAQYTTSHTFTYSTPSLHNKTSP